MVVSTADAESKSTFSFLRIPQEVASCRICRRVMAVAVIAVFAIEALILVPSMISYEQATIKQLGDLGRGAVEAVVASSEEQSVVPQQLVALAGRSAGIDGVAVYDRGGNVVGHAGEALEFTPQMFRYLAKTERISTDQSSYEFLIWGSPPTNPYDVVVRMRADRVGDSVSAFFWRVLGLVLLISAFVGMAIVGSTWKWIVRPVLALRDILVHARQDTLDADKWRAIPDHRDEISDLFSESNALLSVISGAYRDDVAAAAMLAGNATDAVLVYDAKGCLAFANHACLSLCECQHQSEIAETNGPAIGRLHDDLMVLICPDRVVRFEC